MKSIQESMLGVPGSWASVDVTLARIVPCPAKGHSGPGGGSGCQVTEVKAEIQLPVSKQGPTGPLSSPETRTEGDE